MQAIHPAPIVRDDAGHAVTAVCLLGDAHGLNGRPVHTLRLSAHTGP